MGDRANVYVKGQGKDADKGVFLYTHWKGTKLPQTLADALARARDRWQDTQYLARVIFSEMIKDHLEGTTGYGITATIGDNEYPILVVDCDAQTIGWANEATPTEPYATVTFEEFIASPEYRRNRQD